MLVYAPSQSRPTLFALLEQASGTRMPAPKRLANAPSLHHRRRCRAPMGPNVAGHMRAVRRQSILKVGSAPRRGALATQLSDASSRPALPMCLPCAKPALAFGCSRLARKCSRIYPMHMHSFGALHAQSTYIHVFIFCFSQISLADRSDSRPYSTSHLLACRSWVPCLTCLSPD